MSMIRKTNAKINYLLQFHSILENDQGWNNDFSKWNSLTQIKPIFQGLCHTILFGKPYLYNLRLSFMSEQHTDLDKEFGKILKNNNLCI